MKLIRFLVLCLLSLGGGLSASAASNGTITGTITFSAGKFGNAASGFSNANGISLPDISSAFGSTITYCAWIKTPTPASIQVIQSFGTWIAVGSNGNITLGTDASDTGLFVGDNAWHLVQVVYSPSAQVTYVDRVASTVSHSNNDKPSGAMSIGALGSSYFFGGQIDQVTFFNGNRVTAESSIPSSAYTGSEANLIALYPLNSDATDAATGNTSPPPPPTGLTLTPTTFPRGVVTPFTLVNNTGTNWGSGTYAILTGGTNAFLSSSLTNGQTITGTLWPGDATGSLTFGNSASGAGAAATVTDAVITRRVVWHGDSLTAGTNSSSPGGLGTIRIAQVLTNLGPTASGGAQGVAGQTLTQMISQVADLSTNSYLAGASNIWVAQGGHNDISQGASATTVISRIVTYLAAIKSANPNWKIVFCTMLPAGVSNAGFPADFDTRRNIVNAYLRANWRTMGIAALSDEASDAVIGQDGEEYNSTYFSSVDHIHPTDAGYSIWARYDLAALLAAGNPATLRTTLFY